MIRTTRGYTLIELTSVIIILAVLAAVAVPKFINIGTAARVASVNTLADVVSSTAQNVRVMCKLNDTCDYNANFQQFDIGGKFATVVYGWLDAGNCLNCGQIDDWVSVGGFTVSVVPNNRTRFALDSAPTPATCSVVWPDARMFSDLTPHVEVDTSGC